MGRRKVLALVIGAAICVMALAGCSGGSSPSGTFPPSVSVAASGGSAVFGPHNQADGQFAQSLHQINEQGLPLTDLAVTKSSNARVINAAIQYAQTMRSQNDQTWAWLAAWTNPTVSPSSTQMPGLLSDEQFEKVIVATGAQFDVEWARAMATHLAGARQLAETEMAQGENPQAQGLAKSIIDGSAQSQDELKALGG